MARDGVGRTEINIHTRFHMSEKSTSTRMKKMAFLVLLCLMGIVIVFMPFGCNLHLQTRPSVSRPVESLVAIKIYVFDPPLVLPGNWEARELEETADAIVKLNQNVLAATSWEAYLALYAPGERRSLANDAGKRSHWEKMVAEKPLGRHATLFSCVTFKWGDNVIGFCHRMGDQYEGELDDAPPFPFVTPFACVRSLSGQWLLDNRMVNSALGQSLASMKPESLKRAEQEGSLAEVFHASRSILEGLLTNHSE